MSFNIYRYEELMNKKDLTNDEEYELKRLYHMEEYMCGLDGDRNDYKECLDEK